MNQVLLVLKKIVTGLGVAILIVYFVGFSLVSAIAQRQTGEDIRYDTGILGWLMTGKAGAITKGTIWPYSFYVNRYPSARTRQKEAVHRLKPLVDGAVRSGEEAAKYDNTPMTGVPLSFLEQTRQAHERLLTEGPSIDVEVLNSVYPDLGTYFADKLLVSSRLTREAADDLIKKDASSARAKYQRASGLELEWSEWWNSHLAEINRAMRANW